MRADEFKVARQLFGKNTVLTIFLLHKVTKTRKNLSNTIYYLPRYFFLYIEIKIHNQFGLNIHHNYHKTPKCVQSIFFAMTNVFDIIKECNLSTIHVPQNHLLILVIKTLNSLIKCQAKHKKSHFNLKWLKETIKSQIEWFLDAKILFETFQFITK